MMPHHLDAVPGTLWTSLAGGAVALSFAIPDAPTVTLYLGATGLGIGAFVSAYLSRVIPARVGGIAALAEAEAEGERIKGRARAEAIRAVEEAQKESNAERLEEAVWEIEELRASVAELKEELRRERDLAVDFARSVLIAHGHSQEPNGGTAG